MEIIKKYFLFTVGSVCRVKRFSFDGKRFADDKEVETEVRKWQRQQTKDFYVAGFDAQVKQSDGAGYVREINVFSKFAYPHVSRLYIHL
jgi:hypothetical protein